MKLARPIAALLLACLLGVARANTPPTLPQATVNDSMPSQTGSKIAVNSGGDFQAALNAASGGDIIELKAGATFTGNFIAPNNANADDTHWIVIRSSAYGSLPASGTRVGPSDASKMAKIITSGSNPVLAFANGAHHYRFIGIEMTTSHSVTTSTFYNLVCLGAGADCNSADTQAASLPHHIIFDRDYIHGTSTGNIRRGVMGNAAYLGVVDSYISDVHEVGADSQALAAWNGSGPFLLKNSYFEGAGENVMFGGSDPSIPNLVQSDITVVGNQFKKPYTWKADDRSYAGIDWSVKNMFELKNAQRVFVDGNIFERNWPHSQNGFAVLFTPRNQNGGCTWCVVQDVTFQNNIVRHTPHAINFLRQDNEAGPSQLTKRIAIRNNLFDDIGANWVSGGSCGSVTQWIGGIDDVDIRHNDVIYNGSLCSIYAGAFTFGSGTPGSANPEIADNIVPHAGGGMTGDDVALGNATIATYFTNPLISKNIFYGPWPTASGASISMYSNWSATNYFIPTVKDVRYTNYPSDLTLTAQSPYHNAASDGGDVGINWTEFNTSQSGAGSQPTPTSTATPTTSQPPAR